MTAVTPASTSIPSASRLPPASTAPAASSAFPSLRGGLMVRGRSYSSSAAGGGDAAAPWKSPSQTSTSAYCSCRTFIRGL